MSAPICPRCGSPVRAHSVLGTGECLTRTEALAAAWEDEAKVVFLAMSHYGAGDRFDTGEATALRRCARQLREATA